MQAGVALIDTRLSSTILRERANRLTDLRAYTFKSITNCTRSPSHTGLKKTKQQKVHIIKQNISKDQSYKTIH